MVLAPFLVVGTRAAVYDNSFKIFGGIPTSPEDLLVLFLDEGTIQPFFLDLSFHKSGFPTFLGNLWCLMMGSTFLYRVWNVSLDTV